MSWIEKTLGDLISIKRGYDLPEHQRVFGDIPIVGSAGITGFHNKAKVFGGGVTLGRSGNSFGKVYKCKSDFWPHNATLYVNDFKGNSSDYVYYFLKTINFNRYNSGSAQPSLNRNYIYPIKKTPLNFLLNKNFLLKKIIDLEERVIDNKFINFSFIENENEINIFFDKNTYNLIGWQTLDIYQNLSITYLNSIIKNQKLKNNLFKLPKQN